MYTMLYSFSIVTTVSFNQSTYTFNETDGYVYIGLVLSNVSSVDVTVQVLNKDITASELFIYIGVYIVTVQLNLNLSLACELLDKFCEIQVACEQCMHI